MPFSTLILAAGAGTRMKSTRAKVVHELLGKPMIRWVIDAAQTAGTERILTVVGHRREQVLPLVGDTTIVVQEERLGTGHAIMVARAELEPYAQAGNSLVVLSGDTPMLRADTICELVRKQQESQAAVCLMAHETDTPSGYGRVVLGGLGQVLKVVEDSDATDEEKLLRLCNSGAYCFDLPKLLENLERLGNANAQGEFYLTEVFGLLAAAKESVVACIVDAAEAEGVNDRLQLARVSAMMQERINTAWMLQGVTMLEPSSVWIGPNVKLSSDVEILPNVILSGYTEIEHGCLIGPSSRIVDSRVGRDCVVDETMIVDSCLEDGVRCGPRAYIRPGTILKLGSKVGTNVEIKNSTIGVGSKVPHLSYLGDASLGSDVNIGAGTVTCNFDGTTKYPTQIGDRAFIGSDTMLVAPVKVGADTTVGAGSTITRDVPDGALSLERAEQKVVKDWNYKKRRKRPESTAAPADKQGAAINPEDKRERQ
ncbi:MAG: bifunctional UDP-N-acetylglucosamine diphosphorylase/glucosamine-1-phosphate N-acetyltransferase GlmU [Actinomycetia bacterium]|nr:bifunctional UDP-N-acetylglucosamine diphosphorylase/glucosamine-1-phosphate N-acetyltransferase GlmU [Actinomycetes bacterium]